MIKGGTYEPGTEKDIEKRFTYHSPKGDQPERYQKIRDKAKEFAYVVAESCPGSPERSKALGYLDSAVMFANAAIARNE